MSDEKAANLFAFDMSKVEMKSVMELKIELTVDQVRAFGVLHGRPVTEEAARFGLKSVIASFDASAVQDNLLSKALDAARVFGANAR